jgi:hypothetical protein
MKGHSTLLAAYQVSHVDDPVYIMSPASGGRQTVTSTTNGLDFAKVVLHACRA